MANLRQINLGVFPAGEIPAPIIHTYSDSMGVPIDISSWELLGLYIEHDGEDIGPLDIEFATDGTNGAVLYRWTAEQFREPGKYRAIFWIQDLAVDPIQRLGSDLIVYEVKDAPGETPL